LADAPLFLALAIGAATYRTRGIVHRLDLRLPPYPGKEVITIHDLPPLRFPDEGKLPRFAAASARRARAVICPSKFAATEARTLLGIEDIEVIPYGLGPEFGDVVAADDNTLQELGIKGDFVLHAAGAGLRKNLVGLGRAWARVESVYENLQLVLAGPPDSRRNVAMKGLSRVVLPGKLARATIASLMARSACVVVPSLYEGFGLPALEAMACGSPVVAARAGALPEVCGDAALLVEPSGDGLAEGILSVLGDRSRADELRLRGKARATGFSWATSAAAHAAVYSKVAAS
jgi:alpha-1,3-rhamnosyl/mannosyltransferase